eukprot:m.161193 g.161193  ORF g.161193 m.161193 type:complete len:322 (+) comp18050_c0_seq3:944-1909(+)
MRMSCAPTRRAVISCVVIVFSVIAVTFVSTRHYQHTYTRRIRRAAVQSNSGGTFTDCAGGRDLHDHSQVDTSTCTVNATPQDSGEALPIQRGSEYLVVEATHHNQLSHTHTTSENSRQHHQEHRAGEASGLLTAYHTHPRHSVALPFAQRVQHVVLAGMVATVTVTSAKATAVLVDSSATGNKMQLGGLGLVFVFVLLLSLVAQLHFINTSLMVNDALFHLPMFYVVYVFGGVIVGGIVYQEFAGFTWWRWLVFVGGVMLVFSGIKLAADRLIQLENTTSQHSETGHQDHAQDAPKPITAHPSVISLTEPLLSENDVARQP